MDKLPITYHRIEDRHLPDVQKLFWAVFRKKVSVDYLKSKYNTDYLGIQYLCYIAYHENKAVAFYGAIPQRFTYKNKVILAAHACDSFTLKAYQKKGLHYELALRSYDLMKSHQLKFVYAFHSENTYHSTKKLGWSTCGNLSRFHIRVNTLPLSKTALKLGLQKRYNLFLDRKLKPFLVKEPDLLYSSKYDTQVYNIEFSTYKNSFNPHYFIALYACSFWIKVEAVMQVGFFSYDTPQNFQKAVQRLKKIARSLGIQEILFQVSPQSAMHKALSELAPAKQSWRVGYLCFEELDMNRFEFTFADLDTY